MKLFGDCPEDYVEWRQGSGNTVEIFDIVVGSERRKGRGRKMIEKLVNKIHAAEEPETMVFAITRIGNIIAHQFYEACGFRIVGRLHNFYRDENGYESALMYGLDL